jgi:hypothetical protein
MNVTTGTTKVAWRRDPDVPPGQPTLGSFRCPCGEVIEGVDYASGKTYTGGCGRTWDSRGWLVQS